ncbi:NUDIX hydrolase [Catenovulum sp. SM1970]|uniref:NUDIX domain-containing protein n=1 Tax=Marinifaba aquimaris TaxID=2741323 RepID=UPI0015730080|nr:NUDIX hydrolase [Marinifaba aquimaris]NTS77250.1 NUDIX hydrolase [Marinifaba aquimaris]
MLNKSPWQTLSTQKIYQNPWIKVREDKVITPAGTQGIYGVVEFQNRAIGVIPIDKDGNTILVGQYRYPLEQYSWEIPEGGCPEGETAESCAHRELTEETGLIANKLTPLMTMHLSNSCSDEVAHVFIATELSQGQTNFDETEDIKIKKLALDEAIEMVHSSQITDAISVAALLKVHVLKLSGALANT